MGMEFETHAITARKEGERRTKNYKKILLGWRREGRVQSCIDRLTSRGFEPGASKNSKF